MNITAKVVARMQTGGKDFARVGIKGPKGVAALRFFDLEDHGELNIGDKLSIEIIRIFEVNTTVLDRNLAASLLEERLNATTI